MFRQSTASFQVLLELQYETEACIFLYLLLFFFDQVIYNLFHLRFVRTVPFRWRYHGYKWMQDFYVYCERCFFKRSICLSNSVNGTSNPFSISLIYFLSSYLFHLPRNNDTRIRKKLREKVAWIRKLVIPEMILSSPVPPTLTVVPRLSWIFWFGRVRVRDTTISRFGWESLDSICQVCLI